MNESLEVTNVKNESTESISSDQREISPEMQVKSVKQDSSCSIQSEIYIKTVPPVDENEFPVIAGTYGMYPNYDMKFETDEPMVKIEHGNIADEIMQDPLDIGSEIKDEGYLPIGLDQGKSGIKTEPIEDEKDKIFLESDENFDSHESASNLQEQLLNGIDPNHKDKKYICNECNKTFSWKSHLNDHLRIHTGEKPFSCMICKKSFRHKSTLDGHMLIHSGEKPHSCDICQKDFSHKSTLRQHKFIHESVKKFSCDVCEKLFVQKQDLVVHKRIHTGKKPFSCTMCNKAFITSSQLIVHNRTHTGEKPYSCNICTKSFADKGNLNRHKNIHKK